MDPGNHHSTAEKQDAGASGPPSDPLAAPQPPAHDLFWLLLGKNGLRAGWSALIFLSVYYLLLPVFGTILVTLLPDLADHPFAPRNMLIGELDPLLAMVAAFLCIARIEHRRIFDYNLTGTNRLLRFFAGFLTGFAAISVLVGGLAAGGWVTVSPAALSGASLMKYACVWGGAFLFVALIEEGTFRCFLLFTVTRGVNFWWALAAVSIICLRLMLKQQAHGIDGVYVAAAIGLVPCWYLHRVRMPYSNFWQAAWVTSTAFGSYHTDNPGETAIGIFAAALIGFVFCVAVRVTGSAWWGIGCHAAWDWAETYFYGTADSGLVAQGHYLTTTPSGNPLWSGGSDGPEGSLLVIAVSVLLLAVLVLFYGRRKPGLAIPAAHQTAGS
ncbi:MAG TPA: CPBP family intramembrane glutamic endopeptidase [Terracidiphilus sp.]|nr:CPBP family intramembrane glutamic endopeptidase [Terracidiphilus sp.]